MAFVPQQFSSWQQRLQARLQQLNQPHYFWLTRPALAFLITRFIVFAGAYLAEVALPSVTGEGFYHVKPSNIFLDVWARWDSGFYLRIAESGYWFTPGQQSSVAFFPVYPLLINLLAPLVGSTLAAGVLVSNLCLLGALILLYLLTELEFKDSAVASRTVFYIAAFPTAFFFTAVYTESTFLIFSIGTVYFARRRLWAWAALFGILCSAARIIGVIIWGVVLLEWLQMCGWTLETAYRRTAWVNLYQGIRQHWISLLIICLIPLGLLSYMVFLKREFNDPVAFSTAQSAWGRQTVGPWTVVWQDLKSLAGGNLWTGRIWYHVIFNLGAFFAVLFISIAIYRRLGAGYAIYSLLSVLIPSSSGSMSLTRYVLVIFPVFMMLGYWGKYAWLDRTLLMGFSVFLGIFTAIFVNWVFIA